MNSSIKRKSIRGLILVLVIIAIAAKSFTARAQGKKTTYYGYGISLSLPQQAVSSNIQQINGLKVNFTGCNLGGMIANSYGKLKANIGMYYSGSSVPYEMDMIRGSISGNIYLLRLNKAKVKNHLFEPYFTTSISQQVTKFYGNYLSNDPGASNANGQPYLGKVNSTRINAGVGIELQLENDYEKFIHLFAEVTYGVPISSSSATLALSQTKVTNAMTFNLGVNFGVVKSSRAKR
ncbi:hypothetical protein WSM22_13130 [Cytophagales bacterium WSM2-2]|nr:hypothetical protein WSM22_13130 [Cytophagales bacterium WSM2-2]